MESKLLQERAAQLRKDHVIQSTSKYFQSHLAQGPVIPGALMLEMSNACKYHRQAMFISSSYYFRVAH